MVKSALGELRSVMRELFKLSGHEYRLMISCDPKTEQYSEGCRVYDRTSNAPLAG